MAGKKKRITLKAFEHKCYNCGAVTELCIDHHRPLIKKFALALDNAVVLCSLCNSKKGQKDPEEFYGTERCAELDKKLIEILKKGYPLVKE